MVYSYEIIRLKLINFTHFSNILGCPEFEIKRKPNSNPLILILAGNGSGKSLLMSHWSPKVADSTNNRKRIINDDGGDSIKEVDILKYNDKGIATHLYKCRIVYSGSSTNCSLIEENFSTGERKELNPNGLVTSYEVLLEEIFNLDKRYTNITYLSPQITSLVAMSPATRYNYISTWLPDITSYINAYRNIYSKINTVKKQIKLLETDIGGISIDGVNQEISMLTTKAKSLEVTIDDIKTRKMKLSIIQDNLANVSKFFLQENIEKVKRNISALNKEFILLNELDSKSKKYRGDNGIKILTNDINICEKKISDNTSRIEWVSKSIDEHRIRLKEIEYNLGLLKDTGESLPDISSMIERIENSLIEYVSLMDQYKIKYTFLNEIDENFSMREFEVINSLIFFIKDRCDKIQSFIHISELDSLSQKSDLLDRRAKEISSKLLDIDIESHRIHENISLLKNSPLDESILDLKPESCDEKTCKVIKEIKRLLSPDEEIIKLQTSLENLYRSKSKFSSEIEDINTKSNNIILSINYINDINHSIFRDKKYISLLPEIFIKTFDSESIQTVISNMNILVRNLDIIKEFVSMRDQYSVYDTELKKLKDKEVSLKFIRSMNNDINNITKTIDSLYNEKRELIERNSNLINELEILKEILSSINNIKEKIEIYNINCREQIDIYEKLKKICKDWYYREKISRKIYEYTNFIESMNYDLNKINNEIDSKKTTLNTKKTLIEMRDKLFSSMDFMNLLMSAWDLKTGIPSLFIKNFIVKVHAFSNIYLKKLNGDTLKISKFEIGDTAREFPIEVVRGNTKIPDVSSCSEGEIALLSLAISMALLSIVRMAGGYNIIRIDELDSHLDSHRRKLFVEMIQEQIEELNSKQCIMITHNNEFDSVPADVILLPGASKDNSLFKNKNILLDLRDISIDNFD